MDRVTEHYHDNHYHGHHHIRHIPPHIVNHHPIRFPCVAADTVFQVIIRIYEEIWPDHQGHGKPDRPAQFPVSFNNQPYTSRRTYSPAPVPVPVSCSFRSDRTHAVRSPSRLPIGIATGGPALESPDSSAIPPSVAPITEPRVPAIIAIPVPTVSLAVSGCS